MRTSRTTLAVVAALAGILALSPLAITDAQQPRRGGVLRFALAGDPPTLDPHATTALIAAYIMQHVLEPLFTINSRLEPAPMLAERYTVGADRRTYTITLRRGVMFHHGREMTSEDVVASLTRWGRINSRGRVTFANVESLTARDPYTVVFRLKEPNVLLITDLAWWAQPAVIYPKDVLDEAGNTPLRRFIGTGPFRFVEYVPDRVIRLERFDRYAARTDKADGMAGQRVAYLDGITYTPVPDPAVRTAQVQRNEVHFAEILSPDEFDRLRREQGIVPVKAPLPSTLAFVFNKKSGPMTSLKLRQAFAAALDMTAILRATYGHPEFFRMNNSLLPKEHYMWTDAGKEEYNKNDPALARRLAQEAGYRGEPIRWLVISDFFWAYNSAPVAKANLERAGFSIDLRVTDWPTNQTLRNRFEGWDITPVHFPTVADPTIHSAFSPAYVGWYESREQAALMALLRRHSDRKVRMDLWRRAQALFWKELPMVVIGEGFFMHAHRPELKGYTGLPSHHFWNTWLEPAR
ncbi:MAG: ABC transporter substrate-binding protein [Armatimonadota bacterium]|nr:ABC transporter substrate-binding protein [Armatimonadota bacterium]